MMEWLKTIILGAFAGAYYAFISFYLLSPSSNFSFLFIISFGLQGLLFAASYKSICIFFGRYKSFFITGKHWPYHIMGGAISGLISGSINILLTYNAHLAQREHIVTQMN